MTLTPTTLLEKSLRNHDSRSVSRCYGCWYLQGDQSSVSSRRTLWQLSLQAQQPFWFILGPAKSESYSKLRAAGFAAGKVCGTGWPSANGSPAKKSARRPCDLVMLRSFSRSPIVESCLDDSDKYKRKLSGCPESIRPY